jgi:hypothetical protein
LQDHLYLRSALDVDVGAAGEERYQAGRRYSGSNAGDASGKGMP